MSSASAVPLCKCRTRLPPARNARPFNRLETMFESAYLLCVTTGAYLISTCRAHKRHRLQERRCTSSAFTPAEKVSTGQKSLRLGSPCEANLALAVPVGDVAPRLNTGDPISITQRRRRRDLGRCAGVCWAMSDANRNRSSTRKCERPADVRTNGSGGAMLVHAVGRYRSPPLSSRKQTRSSPQARYWSMSRSSRP
jgi:hypothetical protein